MGNGNDDCENTMNQNLTICYCTSRQNPRIEWFLDSMQNQLLTDDKIKVVIVNRFELKLPEKYFSYPVNVIQTRPKPCVWQGEQRLTKEDWFAAANSRNTGLCLASDGWIAYVDDLSVLLPTWFQSVREAMKDERIICGSYQKVKELVVKDGLVESMVGFDAGVDTRSKQVGAKVTSCKGEWLYGCSCVMPVESLLTIGGWYEQCDGLGFEDVCTGIMLGNAGFRFNYDLRMKTYESEEAHTEENAMNPPKRTDRGISPYDKSHSLLRMARTSKYFDNWYEGGIRAERERVLRGEPFTIRTEPKRDFYDGKLISEF